MTGRGPPRWWWMTPAVAVLALALWRGSFAVGIFGLAMLAATATKWALYDVLYYRLATGCDAWPTVALNWQFAAGAIMAVAGILTAYLIGRRIERFAGPVASVCGIVGVLLLVWGGSFEIDRYCVAHASVFADPGLATQMGLSIWWALSASVILIVGFVRDLAAARYLAMTVFAVTLAKVFLFDMRGVNAVYRILSFLALGVLMVAASFLYHRYFRPRTQ